MIPQVACEKGKIRGKKERRRGGERWETRGER
jgi:hypothetical protein